MVVRVRPGRLYYMHSSASVFSSLLEEEVTALNTILDQTGGRNSDIRWQVVLGITQPAELNRSTIRNRIADIIDENTPK